MVLVDLLGDIDTENRLMIGDMVTVESADDEFPTTIYIVIRTCRLHYSYGIRGKIHNSFLDVTEDQDSYRDQRQMKIHIVSYGTEIKHHKRKRQKADSRRHKLHT